ncbi:hypothetical protein [Nostoc sp. NMS1]|uniref:hypothetical protein n=1 Tax=Nostoc sp. NMS1 TaxID=2815388 RepID=UPI0025F5B3FA|nr:hypothetical protein [Nostoc sp. NMS1]
MLQGLGGLAFQLRDELRLAVGDRFRYIEILLSNAILTFLVLKQSYCSAFYYLASHLGIEPKSKIVNNRLVNDK